MLCRDFTKSKEGIAEFEKLGLKYEDSLQDELYETWLTETTVDNLAEFAPNTPEKQINTIHVKQVATGEYTEEGNPLYEYYIIYDVSHTRIDKAGNPVSRYLPKQGTYPIPVPHYKLGEMTFGKAKREVDFVSTINTGYVLKWNKANLLKLIKQIPLRKEGVAVGIATSSGLRFTVARFEDLLNKTWDELIGKDVTADMLATIIRKRQDQISGLQERPVTASDVEKMLEQQQQAQQQQQQQQKQGQS